MANDHPTCFKLQNRLAVRFAEAVGWLTEVDHAWIDTYFASVAGQCRRASLGRLLYCPNETRETVPVLSIPEEGRDPAGLVDLAKEIALRQMKEIAYTTAVFLAIMLPCMVVRKASLALPIPRVDYVLRFVEIFATILGTFLYLAYLVLGIAIPFIRDLHQLRKVLLHRGPRQEVTLWEAFMRYFEPVRRHPVLVCGLCAILTTLAIIGGLPLY
ncbi:MAG: hypothetical protein NTZ17_10025 [Phycisphaerae bacterium]|nr:hypothetical protein [Phycisphaerae bacterium]